MPSPNGTRQDAPPVPEFALSRRTFMNLIHSPATAWTILMVSIGLTGLGWWVSRSYVEQRAAERFQYEVDRAEELIRRRMLRFEGMLIGGRGLHYSGAGVTRQEWRNYVAALRLPEYYAGVQAMGFIRWVTAREKADYEAQVRGEGFSTFAISPPGEREEYACVTYIEPFENRNLRAFGYDLWSEPVRQAGLSRARDTGLATLTGKMFLVQETGTNVQPGVIMLVPMYRPGQPIATVEQRRAALFGWVHAPFRMGDLMHGILGNTDPEIGFELFDGAEPSADALLYDTVAETRKLAEPHRSSRTETRRIELAGRPWTLRFHTQPAFEATTASNQPFLIAFGGLTIDALLFAIIWSLGALRKRAERLAADMTANYRHANEVLAGTIAGHEQTEIALRASEERWRQVIEAEPECVKLLARDGSLLQMNPAGLKMIEADSFDQVSHHCVYPLVTPEHRAQFQELTERVFRGESGVLEFQILGLKGTPRWLETHATPLRDEQGEITSLLAVTRDISERKRSEMELRSAHEWFEALFQSSPLPIGLTSTVDGRILDVNQSWVKLSGFTREEALGRTPWEIGLWVDIHAREALVKRIQQDGSIHDFETKMRDKHGREVDMLVSGQAMETREGPALLLTGMNVTERKRTEAALREAEARLRLSVAASNIGMWDWNLVTNEVYFSPEWKSQLGYADDEVPNRFTEWEQRLHPDDLAPTLASVRTFIEDPLVPYAVEFRLRHKDGSYRWIFTQAQIFRDADGRPARMIGCHIDITERKSAEDQRRRLESQLRQSQKMEAIGTLAGGIAHDFNNILGAILVNVAMAKQDVGPGHPALELLDQIHKSGQRAVGLVQQILAFSREEPKAKRLVKLSSSIEEDARMLRATIPAGVQFNTHVSEDAPDILADPTEIHQVLLNLCTNAWYAMGGEPGHVTLRLEGVTVDADLARNNADLRPGRYARLTVSDTGKGMDAATMERIFEPFFTTKEIGQGTGLGLSVVHGIVKNLQGAITVTSQPGRGTTFELYFPAAGERVDEPELPISAELPRGDGQRILFLDDEKAMMTVGVRMLERQGYRVTGFTRAADALAAVRADPGAFDLVVSDYNMPAVSGINVARELGELRRDLPVILTSGNITKEFQAQARAAGVRELLCKPYSTEEFCRAVHSGLHNDGRNP